MSNEKAEALESDGSNTYLNNSITMTNHKPIRNKFQYHCSFCWRELPNGGVRFAGFGVCPPHLKLAETIVDALRRHRARYFKNLRGAK